MAAANDQPANRWADLVGKSAEEAKKKIQEDHPHLHVVVVPKDGMMTMDYNPQRVRIFKDANEKVSSIPRRG